MKFYTNHYGLLMLSTVVIFVRITCNSTQPPDSPSSTHPESTRIEYQVPAYDGEVELQDDEDYDIDIQNYGDVYTIDEVIAQMYTQIDSIYLSSNNDGIEEVPGTNDALVNINKDLLNILAELRPKVPCCRAFTKNETKEKTNASLTDPLESKSSENDSKSFSFINASFHDSNQHLEGLSPNDSIAIDSGGIMNTKHYGENVPFFNIDSFNTTFNPWRSNAPSYNVPVSKEGVLPLGVYLWPKNIDTGTYDIPIIYRNVSHLTKQRIRFVIKYLKRAIPFQFRRPHKSEKSIVLVSENVERQCYSTVGISQRTSYTLLNLPSSVCNSIHIVMHEILHVLGFGHEHERNDTLNHYDRLFHMTRPAVYVTQYDELSIMSYPEAALGPTKNATIREIAKTRRSFLSRCDWSLLLTLYPSEYVPPKCIPNYIANLLVPSPMLERYYTTEIAQYICRYQNEHFFDAGFCYFPNFKNQPDIEHELYSSDIQNLQPTLSTWYPTSNVQLECYENPEDASQSVYYYKFYIPGRSVDITCRFCQAFLQHYVETVHRETLLPEYITQCLSPTTMDKLIQKFYHALRIEQHKRKQEKEISRISKPV